MVNRYIIITFAHYHTVVIMCKSNDNSKNMIDQIKKYIEVITDSEIIVTKSKDATKKLPLFVTESFYVYDLLLFTKSITLLYQKEGISNTPNQLSKIETLLLRKIDTIVVFAFDRIESYNKQRLISKRINFVIKDKQLFIPSLLIDLNNKDHRMTKKTDSLTPLAQVILLYHLQVKKIEGYTTQEIASLLNASYITTSRAIKSLENLDIIQGSNKKEKKITFKSWGKELWNENLKYLKSPIKKILYTDEVVSSNIIQQSHINALAHYTMIAEDKGMQYAITAEKLKRLGIKTDTKFGENRIEVWKYDPELLSKEKNVDKLSLYLSLRDNTDDRVQIELEQLIHTIKW